MAIISIQYFNASQGSRLADIGYDDVAKVIDSGFLDLATGSPARPANYVLYEDADGYKVKVQNTSPYAYVSAPPPPCSVAIDSVTPTSASTNQASDGSVIIAATSNGSKQYSLDNISWQSSSTFNSLAPGTYTARVRSRVDTLEPYCYATEEFTIAYTDVVCELELGNINTTQPTTAISNDGEIHINSAVDPIGLELEYRLDAGAWQSSPVFTGLDEGTYSVQVRYKDFPTCTDDREIVLAVGAPGCDLQITDIVIVHEQTRYGDDGSLTIVASSTAGDIEYRINGGAYQTNPVFADLSPGTYLVEVKDGSDCVDSSTVELKRFKIPYFDWPTVNGIRVVPLSGNFITSQRQNFDNTLFAEMDIAGVLPCLYPQKVTTEDLNTYQFRSSYEVNTLKIYNALSVLQQTITPVKTHTFLGYSDVRGASFADAGDGEVQAFFSDGLPTFYEAGQDIVVSENAGLNGSYVIKELRAGTLEADGYNVIVFDKVWPGGTILSGEITLEYDLEPYNVFEFAINYVDLTAGQHYFILEGEDDQFGEYEAQSEPIHVAAEWPGTRKIDYRNSEDKFRVLYSTGITHRIRVEGVIKWPVLGGTRTVDHDSSSRLRKIAEDPARRPQVFIYGVPPYLTEKTGLAFAHDYFTIDDVEYQTDQDFEPEYFENDPFANGKCTVEQVDFLSDNSDDSADVDNEIILEINNQLMSIDP